MKIPQINFNTFCSNQKIKRNLNSHTSSRSVVNNHPLTHALQQAKQEPENLFPLYQLEKLVAAHVAFGEPSHEETYNLSSGSNQAVEYLWERINSMTSDVFSRYIQFTKAQESNPLDQTRLDYLKIMNDIPLNIYLTYRAIRSNLNSTHELN